MVIKFPRRKKSSFYNIYSRWDGTQSGPDISGEDILDALSDDLMASNDIQRAIQRMLQRGFRAPSGEWVKGLQELKRKMAERRQEILSQNDLGGIYDEIAKELEEITSQERAALDNLDKAADAESSSDSQAAENTRQATEAKRQTLDNLPDHLAQKIQALSDYEFSSEQASAQFEDLLKKLKEQLTNSYMNQLSQDMSNADPQKLKDFMNDLNEMLEARERGEDPKFEEFMERHQDMFGDNKPQSLDELLESMAQSMAAMQAMWNSMSPDQRQQLQEMAQELMKDMDLQWQASRLSENLRNIFQNMDWDASYKFDGQEPMNLQTAPDVFSELGDLDAMEQALSQARSPADLGEIDLDRAYDLLDEQDAASLAQMAEIAKELEESGLITQKGDQMILSPKAIRRIGQKVLGDIMKRMDLERQANHPRNNVGEGHELEYQTKPYEWGDPFNVNLERTIRNAITRKQKTGTPVDIDLEDFEINRTEQLVSSSTVLMLDLSLSMVMRDNFVPAKKVAIALQTLINSKFPRDYLGIVGFSSMAKEITAQELPEVDVSYFDHGTNMEHAIRLSRSLLAHRHGTRQIIMITDGEPTAHVGRNGGPEFYYPPVRETIDKTMAEVLRASKENIIINIFMLDSSEGLKRFVEHLTRLNGGRAFFTTQDTLGEYVISDFVGRKGRAA